MCPDGHITQYTSNSNSRHPGPGPAAGGRTAARPASARGRGDAMCGSRGAEQHRCHRISVQLAAFKAARVSF